MLQGLGVQAVEIMIGARADTPCKLPGIIRRLQQRRQARAAAAAPPRTPRPPCRLATVAAAAQQEEVEGAFCFPAFVNIDNNRSKCFSVLEVEVVDYPGLLRVLSWILNGLDVVAQNAIVRTAEDTGTAHNTFWLTDRLGEKLSDEEAELLAERVRALVTYCSPDESATRKTEFCAGPIHVSSSMHEKYTVLTVREPKPTPGFLLEVVSALSGMNVCILQGVVQGIACDAEEETLSLEKEVERELSRDKLEESACLWEEQAEGRTFVFWLRDSQGKKLDYAGMTSLLYTLSSVLGYRSHPTVPPDQEMLLSAR